MDTAPFAPVGRALPFEHFELVGEAVCFQDRPGFAHFREAFVEDEVGVTFFGFRKEGVAKFEEVSLIFWLP
jgi:hypothetical protein